MTASAINSNTIQLITNNLSTTNAVNSSNNIENLNNEDAAYSISDSLQTMMNGTVSDYVNNVYANMGTYSAVNKLQPNDFLKMLDVNSSYEVKNHSNQISTLFGSLDSNSSNRTAQQNQSLFNMAYSAAGFSVLMGTHVSSSVLGSLMSKMSGSNVDVWG
ncbi:hypothetical protein [Pectinatus brassicae]|uniref:Uncharacterized protein n=1 Tax=Pectinatus brassicae TaxID=862415 RepID=A0A840UD13_9FIRM|nr:hypothetical protein [Pectinatus brassicae]MBB5334966.1 hypothetical protein [Pectinatus brassicae]